MLQTKPRFQNFEDYLAYDDGTDNLYELYNGELIAVPPESGFNVGIANFLFAVFLPIVGYLRLRGHGLELEVRGEPRNRFPDLTIIREEHIQQIIRRNTIRMSMAPPLLVVEVVSPGELQQNRDYVAKRSQYQDLGIPEYWLIDPQQQTVTILTLQAAVYIESIFRDSEPIVSTQFPDLNLSAEQILRAGA
ncbi:MAG: Uma2 family endonuclease [Pegethrix bostrychoides GSE-TBD4-15B]|jgi:Uma2 family endonuclease|uniref:Uma2 family endonuclease n=1 Tax=Pegethrix bostrychoides GSE-TBD4-15B TaxID=2839662 RepID=A0A951PAA6_9CYAN|nr:Uma2 family endonuclease [Pegethrix bostrychoides GSE-TBD4-15B]